MSAPTRIQSRRTKGWRKPPGAVYVGRPSKWGNPFFHGTTPEARAQAVDEFRVWLRDTPEGCSLDLEPLRGRDLMCWCPLDGPCHADILIEEANR